MSLPLPRIRYLDTADGVAALAREIAGAREIALDTEGASFFRFIDRIYLVQLSTRETTAVIDPLGAGPMPELRALVEDPAVEIVLHDADGDLRRIETDYGWRPTHLFDTRVAAQLLGLQATGLASLFERYLGIALDKKHQRADWSMRPLPADMLEYAARDTHHLLALRDHLAEALVAAGRWSWAEEEFAVIERAPRQPREERAPAFLRFKAAPDLSPRRLALLRELVAWREGAAQAEDRALFRIAADEVLVAIARVAPQSREALGAIPGITPFVARRYGTAIVAAVARGLAVPNDELPRYTRPPRPPHDPELERTSVALKAARDEVAKSLGLDPTLLLPRERLESVARRRPASLDELATVPGVRRWHVDVLGEALLRALARAAG